MVLYIYFALFFYFIFRTCIRHGSYLTLSVLWPPPACLHSPFSCNFNTKKPSHVNARTCSYPRLLTQLWNLIEIFKCNFTWCWWTTWSSHGACRFRRRWVWKHAAAGRLQITTTMIYRSVYICVVEKLLLTFISLNELCVARWSSTRWSPACQQEIICMTNFLLTLLSSCDSGTAYRV